ncbi:hypothetical protein PBK173_000511600, partial [Plasmodium berghei]
NNNNVNNKGINNNNVNNNGINNNNVNNNEFYEKCDKENNIEKKLSESYIHSQKRSKCIKLNEFENKDFINSSLLNIYNGVNDLNMNNIVNNIMPYMNEYFENNNIVHINNPEFIENINNLSNMIYKNNMSNNKNMNEMNCEFFENNLDNNNNLKISNSTHKYMQDNMNNYILQKQFNLNNNIFFNNNGMGKNIGDNMNIEPNINIGNNKLGSIYNNSVDIDVNNLNDDQINILSNFNETENNLKQNKNEYNYVFVNNNNMNLYEIKKMEHNMEAYLGISNYRSGINASNDIYDKDINLETVNPCNLVNDNVYMNHEIDGLDISGNIQKLNINSGNICNNYFMSKHFNGGTSNIHNTNKEMHILSLKNAVEENTIKNQTVNLKGYQMNCNSKNINNLHNGLYMQNTNMNNVYKQLFSNAYNNDNNSTRISNNNNDNPRISNNNNCYQYMNK